MSDTTAIELVLPKSIYLALAQAAERKKKTEAELAVEAIQAYLEQFAQIDPLLGLFADEPELIDSIARDTMQSRATPTTTGAFKPSNIH